MSKLDGIGDVGDYKPRSHVITPEGFTEKENDFLVKLYMMVPEGDAPYIPSQVDYARSAVHEKLKRGKARRHCGMGVAIISPGVLNIGMWGRNWPNGTPPDSPSLIHPYLFEFPEARIPEHEEEFTPLGLDTALAGSHCLWELGLFGQHEARVRFEYLESAKQDSDKIAWRDDVSSFNFPW